VLGTSWTVAARLFVPLEPTAQRNVNPRQGLMVTA
jgi:hypothetical protein